MTEPRSAAGRALHFTEHWGCRDGEYHGPPDVCPMVTAILAIEAEAREQFAVEVEEAVRGLPTLGLGDATSMKRAVLAAIETARRNPR